MLLEDLVGDDKALSGGNDRLCFQLDNNLLLSCGEFPDEQLGLRALVFSGDHSEAGV